MRQGPSKTTPSSARQRPGGSSTSKYERCDGREVVARIELRAGARVGDRAVVQHLRAGRDVDVVDALHVGLVAGNASLVDRLLERLHDSLLGILRLLPIL